MEEKYIIYKGSGGLGHMLQTIRRAIDFSKTTKRKLIIDTANHSAFMHRFNDIFYIDGVSYSDNYDEIPVNYKWNGRTMNEIKFGERKWIEGSTYEMFGIDISKLKRKCNDRIIVFTGTGKGKYIRGLRVREIILNKLKTEEKINGKYIGVQFRNTDMKNNINNFITKIKNISDKTGINIVYFASDDYAAFDTARNALPHIKFIRKTIPPKNIKNLHYNKSVNKFLQIYEALRDIYFLIQSEYFIPSKNSSFSKLIMFNIRARENMFKFKSQTKII